MGQCSNFEEVLNEDFEYTTQVPGYIAGTVYHSTPQTFCPHNGSRALYLNFQNGYTGEAYDWSVESCPGVTYKFSFWAKDCWNSTNNITLSIEDDNGTVLTSTNIITNNQWSQYTTASFSTTVTPIHFVISTNTAGGGGNDLSIDDIVLEACTPEATIDANPIEAVGSGVCNETPITLDLPIASIGYSNPEYQWQISTDNGITWTDIAGADSSSIDLSVYADDDQYRCIIAEQGNLNDPDCRYITDPITLNILNKPTITPPTDYRLCENLDQADIANFQLSSKNSEMSGLAYSFSYHSTLADAEVNTNPLNSNTYINTTNPEKVYIRVEDPSGCFVLDSMDLYALEQPRVDLGPDTSLCEGSPIILDATQNSDSAEYLWQDGSTSPTYNVTVEGNYSVTVTIGNCSVTDSKQLTLYQLPDFDFGPDVEKCIDDTVYLSSGLYGVEYLWSDGSTDPELMVTEFGEYELEITTECGTFIDKVNVTPIYCECRMEVPNSFSPNGDGLNEEFKIWAECEFIHFDLLVYDRWGRQVFKTNDPEFTWPGELEDNQILYVYALEYAYLYSPVFTKNGTISVFK